MTAAVRQRVCGGKVPYTRRRDARLAAAAITRVWSPLGCRPVRAYRCPFCDRFHIGRVPSLRGLRAIAREIRGLG